MWIISRFIQWKRYYNILSLPTNQMRHYLSYIQKRKWLACGVTTTFWVPVWISWWRHTLTLRERPAAFPSFAHYYLRFNSLEKIHNSFSNSKMEDCQHPSTENFSNLYPHRALHRKNTVLQIIKFNFLATQVVTDYVDLTLFLKFYLSTHNIMPITNGFLILVRNTGQGATQ